MKFKLIGIVAALLLCAASATAQQAELGLTVGALKTGGGNLASSSSDPNAHTGNSFALEADLSARFFTVGLASLYFDIPLAVTPKMSACAAGAAMAAAIATASALATRSRAPRMARYSPTGGGGSRGPPGG